MLRIDGEHRARTTYSDAWVVVVIYAGALEGWYRGSVVTHVPGAVKLKEPGEVHRDLRVHAPFTMQGAVFAPEAIAEAADALGLRGSVVFRAPAFAPGTRASQLALAMHDALVRPRISELERETRIHELLAEVLAGDRTDDHRESRAVRRARAFLHDSIADKVTLDALAAHAGLDKFRLVRAFRAEVGLPPYEYLTYLRVSRAREMLTRGAIVADAAHAVGFYDESQLHRHFRRIVGMAPGHYARSLS